MSEEQLWHYISNGQQQGPVPAEELQALAAAGTISPDTQVWTESLDDWIPAKNIEGLFPAPGDQPAQPAAGGPRLITGAAAQTATPLAAAQPVTPAPLAAAPLAAAQPVQPAQPAGGFALGGSLAGGPHLAAPGASPVGGLNPGMEQNFQIRSVGILQAGVVMALLFAITIFILMLIFMIFGGMLMAAAGGNEALGFLAGGGIMLVIAPILYGIFGFIYGIIAALIYNLAAKMCGGLVVKVHARGSW